MAEEASWTGWATDALLTRRSALETGIVIGLAGGAWHVIQLTQLDRSAVWIACWGRSTVAALPEPWIALGSAVHRRPVTALAATVVVIAYAPRMISRPRTG